MKIITEQREIVGILVTQGQRFDLLELSPNKRADAPFWMQNDVYEFLVVNGQGFVQTIIVGKGGFYILRNLDISSKRVNIVVADEEVEKENKPVLI
jgi:hypothetical protein